MIVENTARMLVPHLGALWHRIFVFAARVGNPEPSTGPVHREDGAYDVEIVDYHGERKG
jgi:hypothetical protein